MIRRYILGALALGLLGCTNPLATDGQSDVVLLIAIEGPVQSDVTTPAPTFVAVTIAARSKNIRFNDTQYTRAVQLQRYEVRFYRSDGRNTEGVDVPYAIAGDMAGAVDIGDTDKNVGLSIEVVRSQAKIEPPLRNMRLGGQTQVFTCFAEITIYGRQVASGDILKVTGSTQIDFAGFVN